MPASFRAGNLESQVFKGTMGALNMGGLCGVMVLAAGVWKTAWSQARRLIKDTPVGRPAANLIPAPYDLEDGYLKWRLLPSRTEICGD